MDREILHIVQQMSENMKESNIKNEEAIKAELGATSVPKMFENIKSEVKAYFGA